MDQQKVDMYCMTNQKFFPPESMMFIRDRLMMCDEYRFQMLCTVELKDPTTLLLVSVFAGNLGIDRFMLGDTGMGILKLLTFGCCGILTIIDWFGIQKKTKDWNYNNIMRVIS